MWGSDGPYMHDSTWWSTWPGVLMIGMMVLIAGLLIWVVVRSLRSPGEPAPTSEPHDDAVAQARARYARGELDRDGFTQIMRDLTDGVPELDAGETPAGAAPGAPATTPPAAEPSPRE